MTKIGLTLYVLSHLWVFVIAVIIINGSHIPSHSLIAVAIGWTIGDIGWVIGAYVIRRYRDKTWSET